MKISRHQWLAMRMTFLFLTVVFCQVSARGLSQNVTLEMKDASLKQVLKEIRRQTGFRFFYQDQLLQQAARVNIRITNVPLEQALDSCLKGQPFSWEIVDNTVVLRQRQTDNPPAAPIPPPVDIQGLITDTAGNPLAGVSVLEKGTKNGTTTDNNGRFSLHLPENSKTSLVISSVGYESQTVSLDGRNEVRIVLRRANSPGLGEVVVVAYGTQKRTSVTGAVTTVAPEDLLKNSEPDLNNELTGRAPGVRVSQLSSQPGQFDSQIDIRGFSTVLPQSSNIQGLQTGAPLFVIDGVPRDQATFQMLDPNEIASLSVLKDATASIYGVEAANGVILVTTRKGSIHPVQVNYTGSYGRQVITRYPALCNAYQYTQLYDEQQINNAYSAQAQPPAVMYSPQVIQEYQAGQLPSTNWLRAVLDNNSTQTQHNVNITGGTDKIRFFTSGGYFDQGGLLSSHMEVGQKYNFRADVTAEIAKGLTADVNVGLIDNIQNAPSSAIWSIIRNTWQFQPVYPIYANNNPLYYNQVPNNQNANPLAVINPNQSGYSYTNARNFTSTFNLTYRFPFVTGLSVNGLFAYDNNYSLNKNFNKAWSEYAYDSAANSYAADPGFGGNGGTSQLAQTFQQSLRNDLQFSVNYDRSFGKHHLKLLGLYEQIYNQSDGDYAQGEFVIDALAQLAATNPSTQTVSSNYAANSNRSYGGRFNYEYAGKYLLEGGFREEGSSYFPSGSRWGFFPYASAGWRISEEPFIKKPLPFITNLKLRGSIGKLGDDQGAAASFPAYLTGYSYPNTGSVYGTGGSYIGSVFGNNGLVKGVGFVNSVNPNITWYTSTLTDIGLEGNLWNGKLTFEGDVFRRDRNGLLATPIIAIPGTYGLNLPPENINSDRTEGFEISLGTTGHIGKVNYSISPNMSFARTEWRHYEQTAPLNSIDNYENQLSHRWTDLVWGYKVIGQFKNEQDIYSSPIQDGAGNRTVLPGDYKYEDLNHDGQITTADEKVIATGGAKPLIYFATNFNVSWNGFDISMLWQGATMYSQSYNDQLSRPFYFADSDPITAFYNRWHQANMFDPTSSWIPGRYPSTGQRTNYMANSMGQDYNSANTYNATYLRLKSLQIGYTFKSLAVKQVKLKALRVFASGYNLLTFTGKGLNFVDPEYTDSRLYSYNYPITLNITTGVQVTF
jgi:TonB-linked SusC/RagA family outer membrane protein